MTPINQELMRTLTGRRLPMMIILDIVNYCNLDCIHCPQKKIQSSAGFVRYRLQQKSFDRIIDEIRSTRETVLIRFTGDGEPLLHPDCLNMLAAAAALPNTIVNLTTNGLLLHQQAAERLIDAGIDIIDISIDALTPACYERIRRGGSYRRLMANLFGLLEMRAKAKSSLKVMVSFIEQMENRQELEMFREFWNPLVDELLIRKLHSAGGQNPIGDLLVSPQEPKTARYPCPHLFKRLAVNFQGEISFCAHDWTNAASLGNIDRLSLAEAWASNQLGQLRAAHCDNSIAPESVCSDCTDWASSQWHWGYERLIDRVLDDPQRILLPPLSFYD